MGMFDTIGATLSCPDCGSIAEREIQTKQGPCLLLNPEVGDAIEPFFHSDYWMREQWCPFFTAHACSDEFREVAESSPAYIEAVRKNGSDFFDALENRWKPT